MGYLSRGSSASCIKNINLHDETATLNNIKGTPNSNVQRHQNGPTFHSARRTCTCNKKDVDHRNAAGKLRGAYDADPDRCCEVNNRSKTAHGGHLAVDVALALLDCANLGKAYKRAHGL